MSKVSPNRFAQLCHKLSVLSDLQLDVINEINPDTEKFLELKKNLENLQPILEDIVKSVFDVEEIKRGTYFQELVHKVDTVIRKNYHLFKDD